MNINISFEFYPPRTLKGDKALGQIIQQIACLKPSFVSVTHGAGGSAHKGTVDQVIRLLRETNYEIAAHIAGSSMPKAKVDSLIKYYDDLGIRKFVAIRGDTKNITEGICYKDAAELVSCIRRYSNGDIYVSVYPEKHPASVSVEHELRETEKKFRCGATAGITQFFYDNNSFYRYRDLFATLGLSVPIIVGILPINDVYKISAFCKNCGAKFPVELYDKLIAVKNRQDYEKLAVEVCAKQIEDLQKNGVTNFHFYTLNQRSISYQVCKYLLAT